ncbi:lipase [Biscogniauxia mediterranea]|nr:lipase [Biscogniauxia mediterranea]
MKPLSCLLLSSLASSAAARRLTPRASRYSVNGRATVTTAEISKLEFYRQYASAAYCNSESEVNTTVACTSDACPDVQTAGATIVATYSGEITDIQGFTAVDDTNQLIVTSLKGSGSIRNWITDFVFVQVGCDLVDDCWVHAGFATAWSEIDQDVLASLAAAASAHPSYKLVFTGHSLGGAVSTLGAAYAREQGGYEADVYSYGSPRVGSAALVEFVTAQAGGEYRVTHLDDPVPRLPPLFLGYRHTSPEYWLSGGAFNATTYTPDQVTVCDGYANTDCNAGTKGLDTEAHSYYFGPIGACGSDDLEFRRRDAAAADVTRDMATSQPQDVTDAELEAKLNGWIDQDIEYAASLGE